MRARFKNTTLFGLIVGSAIATVVVVAIAAGIVNNQLTNNRKQTEELQNQLRATQSMILLSVTQTSQAASQEITKLKATSDAASTRAAQPTQTPQPTYTFYPTYTPHPTQTPQPTYTPYPTQPPQPTYTPYPTQPAQLTLRIPTQSPNIYRTNELEVTYKQTETGYGNLNAILFIKNASSEDQHIQICPCTLYNESGIVYKETFVYLSGQETYKYIIPSGITIQAKVIYWNASSSVTLQKQEIKISNLTAKNEIPITRINEKVIRQ